jgi:universal stress protein family protein
MFKKIVVPVDGSAHANRAVDCATDLANKYGAELILLHVMASTGPACIPAELYEYARIEHIDAIEADIMKSTPGVAYCRSTGTIAPSCTTCAVPATYQKIKVSASFPHAHRRACRMEGGHRIRRRHGCVLAQQTQKPPRLIAA